MQWAGFVTFLIAGPSGASGERSVRSCGRTRKSSSTTWPPATVLPYESEWTSWRRTARCTATEAACDTPQRFAYQQIAEVVWDDLPGSNTFFVKLLDTTGWVVTLARPPRGMAAFVQQRVSEIDRQVLLERRLPLDDEGHGVTLSFSSS